MMKRILFVCTGNTCRSPMAEYLLRHKAGDRFEVRSAGLATLDGMEASEYTKQVLAEKLGLSVEHRSQMITPDLVNWADVIFTMTRSHAEALKSQFPEHAEIIRIFKEINGSEDQSTDICDPYGGPKEAYEETYRELELLVERLLDE